MQVILLNYPGVVGEVVILSFEGYVACTNINMKTSKEGDVGPPTYADQTTATTAESGAAGNIAPGNGGRTGGGGRSGGTAGPRLGIDSLTVTRSIDRATPLFLGLAFAKKEDGDVATILICRAYDQTGLPTGASDASIISSSTIAASPGWHQPFLQITLTDVHISSHELTASNTDLQEVITISFKLLDMDYLVFRNGRVIGHVPCHIDLTGGDGTG